MSKRHIIPEKFSELLPIPKNQAVRAGLAGQDERRAEQPRDGESKSIPERWVNSTGLQRPT
jgi:hypothetical protein